MAGVGAGTGHGHKMFVTEESRIGTGSLEVSKRMSIETIKESDRDGSISQDAIGVGDGVGVAQAAPGVGGRLHTLHEDLDDDESGTVEVPRIYPIEHKLARRREHWWNKAFMKVRRIPSFIRPPSRGRF